MSNKQDEQVNENLENLQENDMESVEDQEVDNEKEEVNPFAEMENKLKEINDKYLRLYSEFENFRKRTAREKIELINSGNKSLMLKIIPTIDDFERAIESNKSVDDINIVKEGFELIYHKMMKTLESEGVKVMETNGEPFDVEFHEAITRIPAPDKSLKGKVVDTVEKGYYLNDNVLRYAKVVVGS